MVVSEIFHTLQGEGFTTGMPSVFVRLGMCNLKCNFCDTPYTWKAGVEDYSDEANEQICEAIAKFLYDFPRTRIIVWTGGEPMLQQRDLVGAMDYLTQLFPDRGLQFEVETNGTVTPQPPFDQRVHRYNCSPKTESSGNSQYSVKLKDFKKTTYKYVVADRVHCEEAIAEIDRQGLPRDRCFFMVMGTSAKEMEERAPAIAEVCKHEGINLCIRMQCILWGAVR